MKEAKQLKILFDSNVIIDAITERQTGNMDSKEIFLQAIVGNINGYILNKQLSDMYYVFRKYRNDDKERRKLLSIIHSGFNMIDTTDDIMIEAYLSDGKDYEDDILIKAAEKEHLDYIVTNNILHFKNSKVKAILPQDLVKLFDKKLLEKITNKKNVGDF